MKSLYFSSAFCLALAFNASGAGYLTNFDSYTSGDGVAGQDGWVINDTSDQYTEVVNWDSSRSALLGDASVVDNVPTVAKVVLSHASATSNSSTSVNFDFALFDSFTDPVFGGRDKFGMSLSNGGSNVLSITFVPETPAPANPNDNSENGGDGALWSVHYSAGGGVTVPLNMAIFEGARYDFLLNLSQNAVDPSQSDFSLTITGDGSLTDGATGLTSIDPSGSSDTFGLFWEKSGVNFGSNLMLVDNLTVVPEPSSCLLLGLAGLGFAFRRVRG